MNLSDPVLNAKELAALYGIGRAKLSRLLNEPLCPLRCRKGPTGRIIEIRHTPELAAFLNAHK